ncbi:MAG: hypothetical protein H6671_16955 [Anaerolineaceae bacterium]|nr:hypothetical protein [Anaerolineaceae bacterium]
MVWRRPGADDHPVTVGIYSSGTVELLVERPPGRAAASSLRMSRQHHVLMLKAPQSPHWLIW